MRNLSLTFFTLVLICCVNPQVRGQESAAELYSYDIEEKLATMNIELASQELPPGINILFAKRHGNLIYLSGNGPIKANGEKIVGKLGEDLSVEQGYEAARITAINHLAVLKAELGDLNKVVGFVKVLGMVNAAPGFQSHPAVINGYSDLIVEVFGDRGRHARSAIGVGSLPWDLACEVEAIIAVQE